MKRFFFALFLLAALACGPAQAFRECTALPEATLAGTECLALDQSGSAKRTNPNALSSFALSGTDSIRFDSAYSPAACSSALEGTIYYNSGTNTFNFCDGSSNTAFGGLANIVEDTTPQLGGNLDGQDFDITGGLGYILFDSAQNQASCSSALEGAIFYDSAANGFKYCDGSSNSSFGGIANLVDDTSPQLGGDLDTNGFTITMQNTGLHILDTNSSHDLILAPGSNIAADRTLTLTTGDADRTLSLSGNLTTAADFITSGANSLTLTTTGATNVTLPTTGTLAITASPTFTGTISGAAASFSGEVAANTIQLSSAANYDTSALDNEGTIFYDSGSDYFAGCNGAGSCNIAIDSQVRLLSLTASQIDTLFASPVAAIPAQGAGTIILLERVACKLDWNSAAYTGVDAADNFQFAYASGEVVLLLETDEFLIATADAYTEAPHYTLASAIEVFPVPNEAINIALLGDVATGDSPVSCLLWYKVIKDADFAP